MIPSIPASQRTWRNELNVLPGVLLSLIMIWAVVRSVVVARWASDLEVLIPVVVVALFTGALFARTHWLPPWLAHLLSMALCLTWTVHQVGPLLDQRLTTWRDQATELLIDTIIWLRVLANGGRGEDIVLFITALALLSWILGYASAWFIFRRGWTWWAILINACVILVNYTYAFPKPTELFFVFFTSALLLLVYHNVMSRQEQWLAQDIEYPEFLPLRVVSTAAFFCGIVMFATSLLPSGVTHEQAEQTWETMKQPFVRVRESWEDAFSTINSPAGTSGSSFTARSSALGGARSLGNDVVMYVTATRPDYWRAVAFDKYTSDGWQNTTGEQARALLDLSTREAARTALAPDTTIMPEDIQGRTLITQTTELAQNRKDDFVMVGGQAVRLSLPTLIEHDYKVVQNRLQPNFDDTAIIISQEPLRAAKVYTVTALVSVADVESLRQAGTDYPDWVRQRYLQMPGTITPQTINQAREIVQRAGAETPYDQVIAIQDFLRTFPYNESISGPAANVDPVHYFLFEQQEGYCDYYASAMVMMLRSLDVPARWVQGYANGMFDPERGAYVVRENIAHSWPEVYFPGYGWQRFEPTPASYTSLPLRPASAPDLNMFEELGLNEELFTPPAPEEAEIEQEDTPMSPDEPLVNEATDTGSELWPRLRRIGIIIVAVVGLPALVAWLLLLRWRRELAGLRPAAAAYAQLGILARWAGLPQRAHTTPFEYGNELVRALPRQRAFIARIIRAYVGERYRREVHSRSFAPDLRQLRQPLLRRMVARLTGGVRPPQARRHSRRQR
jgi:transglutaminase-like putative cysteine protease